MGERDKPTGLTKDGNNENIDSLEEVLNILAEESSDWFYGFLSFLYDVMTPFEIIEEEESETADDVDGRPPGGVVKKKAKAGEIKEPARKEKQELKKESKDEEKKKLKRKTDDLDKKDKKAADKAKRDKKAEKERSGLDKAVKNKGTAKELDSGKDKDMKKIAKNLYRVSESSAKGEEKRKRVKG
ncbi:PREDICTED: aspartyl/asparaginyl beta-hydroxylase isoform X4 [Gekko japonicus]|uniref:Aspartyl/asparaginyl beta-hydroxylase isoform X4 n=1 Tax=Gekko japonicus TaxID=146911 RepID=A0ABM1KB71_GEKJA|nr:PREDICTED: aspartyl/asparaginyl beta-hydroxylase isoform X4 [Gekko japonicus]